MIGTKFVSRKDKIEELKSLIENIGEFDSIAVIISRPWEDNVRGETKTYIYPNHITSQINTMKELIFNLVQTGNQN